MLKVSHVADFARLDLYRDLRKGVPEVVFAPRKTDKQILSIASEFLNIRGFVLVSRLELSRFVVLKQALEKEFNNNFTTLNFDYYEDAGTLAVTTQKYRLPKGEGCVGIITAGTADIPVAEEAALVLRFMGCKVEKAYDVGVAGVHRLLEPLTRILEAKASVIVVAAGMEGALPSVVSGLVDMPVIGLPTSTGYGLGGKGESALYAMLQSCSPGLVAVNIDNGVGAGAAAGLIALR